MKTASSPAMKKKKKAMKVSKIARGKFAKAQVLRGSKEKTVGGLSKNQLTKNMRGKVVSKAMSAQKRKSYTGSKLEAWGKAVKQARKELNVTGFVTINGKTAVGKALYVKAKAIYSGKA